MVWWIDSDRCTVCRSKFFHHETAMEVLNDRIFQTTNIMYSLDNSNYDEYDILSLVKSGVNIFNVDLNVNGEDNFKKVKEVINAFENIPQTFPMKYQSPIGLAITMTVNKPVHIDERVDAVILKDVTNLKELLEFKKKHRAVPIMLWINSWAIEDLKPMIQFTDGVFLDAFNEIYKEEWLKVVQLCKQVYKSVFLVVGDIIKDYQALPVDDMRVLTVGKKIIKLQVDGMLIFGTNKDKYNAVQLVRSLVRAIDVNDNENDHDIYELSLKIKIPALPSISSALAASIAAKQSGANIIVVLTKSGVSARCIANASPPCHIVAITDRKDVARRLHLYRKVVPLLYNQPYAATWFQECWNRVVFGTTMALNIGLCPHGGNVVILAPSGPDIGYCNSLQILSIPLKCDV